MDTIVDLYKPENIWKYITTRSDNPKFKGNDTEKEYYHAVKEFAGLCAVGSLNNGSSYTVDRPVDPEFISTFNQMTKAFKNCIDSKAKISLSKIGDAIKLVGDYNKSIDVVCFGNIESIGLTYGPATSTPIEEYVSQENRTRIVSQYVACLIGLQQANDLNNQQIQTSKKR